MEEKNYLLLTCIIDGVYGVVKYTKLIEEKDLKLDLEGYVQGCGINMPDVHFSIEITDCNMTKYIYFGEGQGLPWYLNIDMGTYFKMAQLREIGSIGKNIYIPNRDKEDFKDILKNLTNTIILVNGGEINKD